MAVARRKPDLTRPAALAVVLQPRQRAFWLSMLRSTPERRERARQSWERLTWTRLALWVALGVLLAAVMGYLIGGRSAAVTLSCAIGLGLSGVMAYYKTHPDEAGSGRRSRWISWL